MSHDLDVEGGNSRIADWCCQSGRALIQVAGTDQWGGNIHNTGKVQGGSSLARSPSLDWTRHV